MTQIVYNIPTTLIQRYHTHGMIVRSQAAAEIIDCFSTQTVDHLMHIQLHSLSADNSALASWGEGIPVELVMQEPQTEFPLLYRYSGLLNTHPVRVSIPVVAGFSKAVKLAMSLQFAVKLFPGQPSPSLIEEMLQVVNLYLHQSTVSQPVEYFHSTLLALYHQEPFSLWTIQEEDPASHRYINDHGEEIISPRFEKKMPGEHLDNVVKRFTQTLLGEKRECATCQFFDCCEGYFKWPDHEFRCDGIRTIFHTLQEAANDLRQELATIPAS